MTEMLFYVLFHIFFQELSSEPGHCFCKSVPVRKAIAVCKNLATTLQDADSWIRERGIHCTISTFV